VSCTWARPRTPRRREDRGLGRRAGQGVTRRTGGKSMARTGGAEHDAFPAFKASHLHMIEHTCDIFISIAINHGLFIKIIKS
jgi:hypothetical protein